MATGEKVPGRRETWEGERDCRVPERKLRFKWMKLEKS